MQNSPFVRYRQSLRLFGSKVIESLVGEREVVGGLPAAHCRTHKKIYRLLPCLVFDLKKVALTFSLIHRGSRLVVRVHEVSTDG